MHFLQRTKLGNKYCLWTLNILSLLIKFFVISTFEIWKIPANFHIAWLEALLLCVNPFPKKMILDDEPLIYSFDRKFLQWQEITHFDKNIKENICNISSNFPVNIPPWSKPLSRGVIVPKSTVSNPVLSGQRAVCRRGLGSN